MAVNWESFKVKSQRLSVPDDIFYVPNFLNADEEDQILKHVYQAPKPKWTHLSNRRLQNWGGFPHPRMTVGEPLPELFDLNIFDGKEPNHVLVNEYKPGQGIMPHEDGPLFYPTITTISLGSNTALNLSPKKSGDTESSISLLLQPRSLLIIKKDAYTSYLHGIQEVTSDAVSHRTVNLSFLDDVSFGDVIERGTRISLTIRYVSNMRQNLLTMLCK